MYHENKIYNISTYITSFVSFIKVRVKLHPVLMRIEQFHLFSIVVLFLLQHMFILLPHLFFFSLRFFTL